eukprot:s2756_g1.t1
MVKAWYDEIADYDFGGDYQKGTGHFTQVVWKGSTHVGMALSEDGRFCVANYYPGGNVIGRFKDNVLPRGSPYVPEKAEAPCQGTRRRSSSVAGPGRSVTEVLRGTELGHGAVSQRGQVKLPQRRPSYSGQGSKSGAEARFPDDMSNFFKDLEFPSTTRRTSGYSTDGHSTTVTRKAGYQRESELPTQFQSSQSQSSRRSSSCGGTRSTTTVTKTVASDGTVVTKTTRTGADGDRLLFSGDEGVLSLPPTPPELSPSNTAESRGALERQLEAPALVPTFGDLQRLMSTLSELQRVSLDAARRAHDLLSVPAASSPRAPEDGRSGAKHPLQEADVWPVPRALSAAELGNAVGQIWSKAAGCQGEKPRGCL